MLSYMFFLDNGLDMFISWNDGEAVEFISCDTINKLYIVIV